MGLQVELLRNSFELVAPQADRLAERFYERLFADYPHLEPLFVQADMADQQRKLIQSLVVVVRSLDNTEALTRFLHELGGRHVDYGTTADDYEPFTLTLIGVLAEVSGDAWNGDLESAWQEALDAVAEIMLAGAAKRNERQPALVGSTVAAERQNESDRANAIGDNLETLRRVKNAGDPAEDEEISMSVTSAQSQGIHGSTADTTDQFYCIAEAMPIACLFADNQGVVTYVNDKCQQLLGSHAGELGVGPDEIVGSALGRVFGRLPELISAWQSLRVARDVPLQLGASQMTARLTPATSAAGSSIGTVITLTCEQAGLALLGAAVDEMPINVMLSNTDFEIVYMNRSSRETLKKLEHLLPAPVDKIVGQKIDIFHKNPEMQRRIVSDPANLPHRAKIKVGDETLDLHVSAILDHDGKFVGPMITWDVISAQVALADDFEREVKGVVQIVASSATEMHASSQSMAATTEETSRQAQVVAAASEQATRNVETVSSAAEELSASISEIAGHVQEASRMTSQAVEEAERTNVTIHDLGESSNEIGQVIKVITSIAQQTNLLALNATIEAARAGDAGKGFAVVANEVKELARQTAKATEEISRKIAAIQSATGGAAAAIESIGVRIGKINEIATTIAGAVEEQTAATSEISRNVAEAARGNSEVSSSIAGVSQAADEGGKGAADMLATADSLAMESAHLDDTASRFLEKLRAF